MLKTLTAIAVMCAAPACACEWMEYQEVVRFLDEAASERVVSIGSMQNGLTIETFAADSGSWSQIIRKGDRACIIAMGDDFTFVDGAI